MEKKLTREERRRFREAQKLTQIGPVSNVIFNVLLLLFALLCVLPMVLVISVSFSSETSINQYGYRFIPTVPSLEGYVFLFKQRQVMLRALWMSILVTGLGTVLGILFCMTMGYGLSRGTFKMRKIYNWLVFIPMVFSGGMVAQYYVNTQLLHLKNNLWILILPMAVSSFNIIICRTFLTTTIPDSVIESAKIDGAGQFTIFFKIVLPLSLPVMATIGLFMSFGYWNDWFTAMLYIQNPDLYTLQAFLQKIIQNIENLVKNGQLLGYNAREVLASLPQEAARMGIVILIVLPIACVYPFFQRYFVTGLTVGAVKG
ncbi:ABC transporter permease [Spirochaetia bacterium]|nr:ABC transporter permease [Spirochaetia bacterium]